MIKERIFFGFLYYHFSKVRIKTTFYWRWQFIKQKALHKFTFVSVETKGLLKSIKQANKHIIWTTE